MAKTDAPQRGKTTGEHSGRINELARTFLNEGIDPSQENPDDAINDEINEFLGLLNDFARNFYRGYGKTPEAIDDLSQEALIKALQDFKKNFDPENKGGEYSTRFYTILDTVSRQDHEKRSAKKRSAHHTLSIHNLDPYGKELGASIEDRNAPDPTANLETQDLIAQLRPRLTERQSQVLDLMLKGQDAQEIAKLLECTGHNINQIRQKIESQLSAMVSEASPARG